MRLLLLSLSSVVPFSSVTLESCLSEDSTFSTKPEFGGSIGKRHSKKEAPTRLEVPDAELLVLLLESGAGDEGQD